MDRDRIVYGATGETGKDGLLTHEQQFTLNSLQEKAAQASLSYLATIDNSLPDRKFPLVAMATGIGKGRIIHLVLESQFRKKPDSKVLIVAGTKNVLVHQTHDALGSYQGTNFGIPDAENGPLNDVDSFVDAEESDLLSTETEDIEGNEALNDQSFLYRTGRLGLADANVHVATIQTVQSAIGKNRLKPSEYDLVVVDEVHNIGTVKRKAAIDQFERVVGFTATPYRHSGRMKRPDEYGFEIVESLSLSEAQDLRLLPPLIGLQINTMDVVDEIPTTRSGAIDYKKLEVILKNNPELRPYIADRVASMISGEGKNYKTVIAVNFVWEAQELAELLRDKGIKVGIAVNQQAAKEIDSPDIPALDSIERYKLPDSNERAIQALISPYVASEGFDAPFTEVMVWASPTDSSLRYTQYNGRLARRAEGKMYGVIIDCLYQTSQFSYSYNMAMWMKGNIVQLDNGLLYLGPEQDIDKLKDLQGLKELKNRADEHRLNSLQTELLEVLDTDFILSTKNVKRFFRGKSSRLTQASARVVKQLQHENPELFTNRIQVRRSKHSESKHTVFVITDKDLFIKRMGDLGFPPLEKKPPENLEEASSEDFTLTVSTMKLTFQGTPFQIRKIALREAQILSKTDPNFTITKKKVKGVPVLVVNDKDLLIRRLAELGIRQAEIDDKNAPEDVVDPIKDFVVTGASLSRMFRGHPRRLSEIAEQILEELRNEPGSPVRTVRRHQRVFTVVDREEFIQRMLNHAIHPKSIELEEVKGTDLPLTTQSLRKLFPMRTTDLKKLVDQVIQEIESERPDTLVRRLNKSQIVTVTTDEDLFIQKMLKAGAKLRTQD